ncbi:MULTISPECIES: SAVMC3_10250 family protein [unclassified Streptomyces]|uniref:SAVMC3_10250 family protein n=1 Tax=unclassified Streptomyces TaxID=2593676 RepID=UPI0036EA6971
MRGRRAGEVIYLSKTKVHELAPSRSPRGTGRAVELEAGAEPIGTLRFALGERRGDGIPRLRVRRALKRARKMVTSRTSAPESWTNLLAREWFEFSDFFMCGPVMRDSALPGASQFQGVYGFASFINYACRNENCAGVDIVLCGSISNVLEYTDAEPTRMGSRTEWVHDLVIRMAADEAAGRPSEPPSTSLAMAGSSASAETATRFTRSMLSGHAAYGPAKLHGYARVLFNFPPSDGYSHRIILATPLYVESVPRSPEDRNPFGGCPGDTSM